MANRLSVIFNAVDNISARLSAIASIGENVTSGFQRIEDAANRALSDAQSGSSDAADALSQVSDAADSLADAMNGCSRDMELALRSSENVADTGSTASDALADMAESAEQAGEDVNGFQERSRRAADDVENLGGRTERTRDQFGRFTRETRGAGQGVRDFGSQVSELSSIMTSLGIAKAFGEIEQAISDCATKAEEFETAIAQLQTISGGDAIGELQADIMALSNETGQASEGLADTAYNAISAGTAVADSVNMAATASELAVAGFTDTSSALSVLTTAINSYGDAAGTAEHIADSLVTVQNLGVTTVAQLAQQMGKAISTASAYNVSLENLESGYISVTKAGINAAEGTTYLASMFNELGNSGSTISKVIQEETGRTFGQLMSDGQSVADVLGLIYDKCNQNAEAMMNLWGSAEAGKAANAIISQGLGTFNDNLETLRTGAGVTADAYAIMADTTAYAHNRMDNAAKNLQTTIGGQLNPTLEKLYDTGAELMAGMSEFVEENPAVLKAIAALGVGLTTSVGILTAVSAAENAAGLAAKFFNAELAKSPVLWIVGGVAALAVGLYELSGAWEEATDATDELTFASREAEDRLASLNTEYEKACEEYGKSSDEAGELALQIYELEQSYGDCGETIGQFRERIEELSSYFEESRKTYEDNIASINGMYDSGMTLVSQLQALHSHSQLADSELALMNSIVRELNNSYGDLGLTVNEATGRMNYSISDLYGYVMEQADLAKKEEASRGLMDIMSRYEELKSTKDEAVNDFIQAKDTYEKAANEWQNNHPVLKNVVAGAEMNWSKELGLKWDAMKQLDAARLEQIETYDNEMNSLQEYCTILGFTSEETEELIRNLEASSEAADQAAASMDGAGSASSEFESAISQVADSIGASMESLEADYASAYAAADSSIEGQYNLWDKVGKIASTSMWDLTAALDSQTKYWENYSNNLETLSAKAEQIDGLSDVLKEMDDGSEESASALAAMANASDEQLQKMVDKYQDLQSAQDKTKQDVAELESDFGSRMDEMAKKLQETVEDMNMDEEAGSAARATINSYTAAIREGRDEAVAAANEVANAVAAALNSASSAAAAAQNMPSGALPGGVKGPAANAESANSQKYGAAYASGTMNSEKVYIAGEEGPELIVSGGGDKVFPTGETDRIIAAVSNKMDNPQMTAGIPESFNVKGAENGGGSSASDRTVTIKLEGSGSVTVGRGDSAESVWNSVKGSLKQAFMSLLQEEIYEEGAGAYEF